MGLSGTLLRESALQRFRCRGFWLELLEALILYFILVFLVPASTWVLLAFLSPLISNGTALVLILTHKQALHTVHGSGLANTLVLPGTWGAICLGSLIVGDSRLVLLLGHELGHSKQALVLGPLYWIVVGLPSLGHAGIWQRAGRRWNYYSFYTEAWAEHWKVQPKHLY